MLHDVSDGMIEHSLPLEFSEHAHIAVTLGQKIARYHTNKDY